MAGALCIALDIQQENSPPHILMFEMNSFDIIFKMEIYVEFNKSLCTLNPYFFYYKIPKNGQISFMNQSNIENKNQDYYLGFSFATENQAKNCRKVIDKISPTIEQYNEVFSNIDRINSASINNNQQQFFISENNNTNNMGQNFQSQIKNNTGIIDIDQEKQRLNDISQLTKEEKEIIRNAGISKKQLKSDENVKNIVSQLFLKKKQQQKQDQKDVSQIINNQTSRMSQSNNNQGNVNFMSMLHNQINNYSKENNDNNNLNTKFTKSIIVGDNLQKFQENNQQNIVNQEVAQSNMPTAKSSNFVNKPFIATNIAQPPPIMVQQPPPLNTILDNKNPPNIQNILNKNQLSNNQTPVRKSSVATNSQIAQKDNLLEQIRNNNIKLRHVETNAKKQEEQNYSKEDKIDLTAHLALEMKKRRFQIKKNYMDDSSEEDDSEWDEDSDYDL